MNSSYYKLCKLQSKPKLSQIKHPYMPIYPKHSFDVGQTTVHYIKPTPNVFQELIYTSKSILIYFQKAIYAF